MIFFIHEEKEVIKPIAGAIEGASDGARAVA